MTRQIHVGVIGYVADVVTETLDTFQREVKPALDQVLHDANRAAAE